MKLTSPETTSAAWLKVKLADTSLKLSVQKQLAAMDGTSPELVKPAMEPQGRAANGKAFQQ